MGRFKDYDALSADKETFQFRVGGRDFDLPPELPARLVMDLVSATEDDEAAQQRLGMRIITDTVGKENWEYILDNMGHKGIETFISDVLEFYGVGVEEDPKAEEAPPGPSTTSSPTGEPSTLTSSAFGLIPGGLSTQESSPGEDSLTG